MKQCEPFLEKAELVSQELNNSIETWWSLKLANQSPVNPLVSDDWPGWYQYTHNELIIV